METELPQFLRNLADQVEKGEVSDENLVKISELYMSYLSKPEANISKKEYMKYFTLGWFIYNQLLQR